MLMRQYKQALGKGFTTFCGNKFNTRIIQENLEIADTIPLHKGGRKANPIHKRPVVVKSHVIKVIEKVWRTTDRTNKTKQPALNQV